MSSLCRPTCGVAPGLGTGCCRSKPEKRLFARCIPCPGNQRRRDSAQDTIPLPFSQIAQASQSPVKAVCRAFTSALLPSPLSGQTWVYSMQPLGRTKIPLGKASRGIVFRGAASSSGDCGAGRSREQILVQRPWFRRVLGHKSGARPWELVFTANMEVFSVSSRKTHPAAMYPPSSGSPHRVGAGLPRRRRRRLPIRGRQRP